MQTSREELEALKNERLQIENANVLIEQYTNKKKAEEDTKAKLSELSDDISSLQNLCKDHRVQKAQYMALSKEEKWLTSEYNLKYRAFLDEQAGILAFGLVNGMPCPVCGSLSHPSPASRSEHAPTQEELSTLKKLSEEAQKKAEVLSRESSMYRGTVESEKSLLSERIESLIGTRNISDAKRDAQILLDGTNSEISSLRATVSSLEKDVKRKTHLDTILPDKKKLLVNLNSPIVEKLPSMEEQRLVGRFFSGLDRIIRVQERKTEALRQSKKYYLQNMFA